MCLVFATQSPGQSNPPVSNVKPRAPANAAFRADDMLLPSRLFTSDVLGNDARNGGTCFLLLCNACVALLNALCDINNGCRIGDSRQLCCLQTGPILALSWTPYIPPGGLTQWLLYICDVFNTLQLVRLALRLCSRVNTLLF